MCILTNATAATCDAGYYLNAAGECVDCNTGLAECAGVYCPGDDTQHECPIVTPEQKEIYENRFGDGAVITTQLPKKAWNCHLQKTEVYNCNVSLYVTDRYGNLYLNESGYYRSTGLYGVNKLYYQAGTGYYLSPYRGTTYKVWYNGVKPCTNAPANAHYTGPGTPDSVDGTIKDANDCPWECDAGFGHTSDDRCLPLCRIGETAMNGINIYAEKHTKYAMAVPRGGATCWISATRDNGGKLMPTN